MSIPPRDSFENTPDSDAQTDWARQQQGDRSWAAQDPSTDPANPYGRSSSFGNDGAPSTSGETFTNAPSQAPVGGTAAAPGQANPYAQPFSQPAGGFAQQAGGFGQPTGAGFPQQPFAQSYPQIPQQPYAQPYPGYAAPGYPLPVYQAPAPRGLSITGMVLGIVSIALFMWALLIPPIIGLIFSILGLVKEPRGKGMAITGLILSGAGILFWLLAAVSGAWWSDVTPYSDSSNA